MTHQAATLKSERNPLDPQTDRGEVTNLRKRPLPTRTPRLLTSETKRLSCASHCWSAVAAIFSEASRKSASHSSAGSKGHTRKGPTFSVNRQIEIQQRQTQHEFQTEQLQTDQIYIQTRQIPDPKTPNPFIRSTCSVRISSNTLPIDNAVFYPSVTGRPTPLEHLNELGCQCFFCSRPGDR